MCAGMHFCNGGLLIIKILNLRHVRLRKKMANYLGGWGVKNLLGKCPSRKQRKFVQDTTPPIMISEYATVYKHEFITLYIVITIQLH